MAVAHTRRILIAASGSGGHLLPALYIARALKEAAPEAQIEFVGSGRPLEAKLIDPAGFKRHVINIVGINRRGVKGIVEFALKLPRALFQSWRIVASFKPSVVVGVGGYASVLPVLLATLRGTPTLIHEAELAPGLANRFLSRFATRVTTAFNTRKFPRQDTLRFTGHPVRKEILQISPQIPEGTRIAHLLILGGSQGAESLDKTLPLLGATLRELGISVWHQARPVNVASVTEAYRAAGVDATVTPFIEDMAAALSWSHLVVSRSGAGSLIELSIVNRPVIFVPLPSTAIQQLPNAKVLEAQGKALVVEEGERFKERLDAALKKLSVPEEFYAMHQRPCEGRITDGAERIAAEICRLAE